MHIFNISECMYAVFKMSIKTEKKLIKIVFHINNHRKFLRLKLDFLSLFYSIVRSLGYHR